MKNNCTSTCIAAFCALLYAGPSNARDIPIENPGFELPTLESDEPLPGSEIEGWETFGEVTLWKLDHLGVVMRSEGSNATQLFHYPAAAIWQNTGETFEADTVYELQFELIHPRSRFSGIRFGFALPQSETVWIHKEEMLSEDGNPAPRDGSIPVTLILDTSKMPEVVGEPICPRFEAIFNPEGGAAAVIDNVVVDRIH